MVHINNAYLQTGDFMDHSDGLAVVGFWFKIGTEDVLGTFMDKLAEIVDVDSKVVYHMKTAPFFDSCGNVPPYYHYKGSLTTPGCQEIVSWIVIGEPLTVTHDQMAVFRSLRDAHSQPMVDNYRPVQYRNDREILYYVNVDL